MMPMSSCGRTSIDRCCRHGARRGGRLRSHTATWSWGFNHIGQRGDGTTTDRLIPNRVGSAIGWKSISAGPTLWMWGNNYYGVIGDGTTTTRLVPTQVGADANWQPSQSDTRPRLRPGWTAPSGRGVITVRGNSAIRRRGNAARRARSGWQPTGSTSSPAPVAFKPSLADPADRRTFESPRVSRPR